MFEDGAPPCQGRDLARDFWILDTKQKRLILTGLGDGFSGRLLLIAHGGHALYHAFVAIARSKYMFSGKRKVLRPSTFRCRYGGRKRAS